MTPPLLPYPDLARLETHAVLKKLPEAHRHLAELKGLVASIPNASILINTLALQEARHSSAIENIITTQDDLYKAEILDETGTNPAAKEVQNYSRALQSGFVRVRENRLIRLADILDIQAKLEQNKAGLRQLPGTVLRNQRGETVYTPPPPPAIAPLMDNLITYLNDDSLCPADPLIKMAVIHYQFETIHPFYDGNGRTGRILNILYLVAQDLLDIPVLYLSHYLIRHKDDYYRHLQSVRGEEGWEGWLLYLLEGIAQTARGTIELVKGILSLMQDYKHTIRRELPKIYRQELLHNLFKHPYTKIEFIMDDLGVSRLTAARYLDALADLTLLQKRKIGRSNYYINQPLYDLFLHHDA